MEIADSITVRYLSLAILFANAAPPLLLFAIFEQFQSICNLQGALRGDQPYCSAASKGDVLLAECHVPFPASGARGRQGVAIMAGPWCQPLRRVVSTESTNFFDQAGWRPLAACPLHSKSGQENACLAMSA